MDIKDYEDLKCPCCQQSNFTHISSAVKHGGDSKVVICEYCALVQLNPRFSAAEYSRYYQTVYDSHYRQDTIKLQDYKIRIILNRLQEFKTFHQAPRNILEIGAGNGESLKFLKANVFPSSNYFGIEPSNLCQIELKKYQIKTIGNTLEEVDIDENEGKFDFIILRHVAEHFLTPVASFESISRLLSKDGILYVATPNAMRPTHPIEYNHFRSVHTYYYSRPTMHNIFRLAGLEPIQFVEGDNMEMFELAAIVRKAKEKTKIRIESGFVQKQIEVYKKELRNENSVIAKVVNKLQNTIRKKSSSKKLKREFTPENFLT